MDSKAFGSLANRATARSSPRLLTLPYALLLMFCILLGSFAGHKRYYSASSSTDDNLSTSPCPQVGALYPQSAKSADVWAELGQLLRTDEFQELAIGKLSGLIQIP